MRVRGGVRQGIGRANAHPARLTALKSQPARELQSRRRPQKTAEDLGCPTPRRGPKAGAPHAGLPDSLSPSGDPCIRARIALLHRFRLESIGGSITEEATNGCDKADGDHRELCDTLLTVHPECEPRYSRPSSELIVWVPEILARVVRKLPVT